MSVKFWSHTRPDPESCCHCAATVLLGQDYCLACEKKMQDGVNIRCCGFCHMILGDYNMDMGFCDCGKPTNNAPPIMIPECVGV